MINRDAITALRRGHGLGPAALARKAGITREALRLIERGVTTNPHQNTVKALAEALGVPAEAILLCEETV